MGNICRSPTAEGVMRHLMTKAQLNERIHVDSAATHNYQIGSAPDPRTQQHALQRGYDLSALRARLLTHEDFEHFDLILTMDHNNQTTVNERCPENLRHKVRYFSEFFEQYELTEIPDPYYGEAKDFELVLDLVEDGVKGLISHCIRPS
jgi:protein-tyrosine phosphatase